MTGDHHRSPSTPSASETSSLLSINNTSHSSNNGKILSPALDKPSSRRTASTSSTPSRTPLLHSTRTWVQEICQGKNALLLLYSVLLLVSSVGNSIFFKKMINSMPNYVNFLNQLTTVVFVPIYFVIVVYERLFTDYITKEMLAFPKFKFFVMGALDAVSGVFTLFGAIHTSGSLQALLSNTVIPVTMVMSYAILKTRYALIQYIGAVTIVVGCGVALWPSFGARDPNSPPEDNSLLFNGIFMLGIVPTALSSLYKEVAFVDADIDVNYMQAWVAVWQFIFGFMLIPLNTLSILGPAALEWKDLGRSLADGARCLMGHNIIKPPYCSPDMSQPELGACDHCEGAWIPVFLYLVFNWLFNIFIMLTIKYGSASVMFVVMTLRLPMIQVAFAIPAINDPPDHLYWSSLFGLLVILAGLIAYRWASVAEPLSKDEEEVMVPHIGINLAYQTVRRRKVIVLGRDAKQIRSTLYSSLGIIDSPPTPYSPHQRHGRGGKSPQAGTPPTNAQLRAAAAAKAYKEKNAKMLDPAMTNANAKANANASSSSSSSRGSKNYGSLITSQSSESSSSSSSSSSASSLSSTSTTSSFSSATATATAPGIPTSSAPIAASSVARDRLTVDSNGRPLKKSTSSSLATVSTKAGSQ